MHLWVSIPQVRRTNQPPAPMARDLQTRFFAVILALLSVAAVVFAWINFQKEREFSAPYDGVWWVEDGGHLRAARVDIDGPGQKAGIKLGDRLIAVERTRRYQRRQPGAATLSRWSLVQSHLLAGAPGREPGSAADSGPRRPLPVWRTAADRAGLPRHRHLRSAAALDCAQEHSFLRVLPGFVHLLLVPLHR